jgi:hypothetical protein
MFIRNVAFYLRVCTASWPRRTFSSVPWN